MKKLLVLILVMSCALCLAFSFAGCKPDNSESSGGGSNTQQGDTDNNRQEGGEQMKPPAENQYTVIFNANGGKFEDGKDTKSVTVKENEKLSPPEEPLRDKYSFVHWCTDSSLSTEWNFGDDIVTRDITLYADWEETIVDYNVTFILNYDGADAVVKSTVGGLVTFIPERADYVFNGWWLDDGKTESGEYILAQKWDTAEPVTEEGLVLVAEWVEKSSLSSQLSAPSVSISGNVFSWSPVTGAEIYDIRVFVSGAREEKFKDSVDGTSWTFPGNYEAGYYTVKIRAMGNGVSTVNSSYVSKSYGHLILGAVSNIDFNISTSVVTWTAVKNATAYELYVDNRKIETLTYTTYDLSDLDAGSHTLKIAATREGYQSSAASTTINKLRLKKPVAEIIVDYSSGNCNVSWQNVVNADTYILNLNEREIRVTDGVKYSFDCRASQWQNAGEIIISVTAFDSDRDYLISEAYKIRLPLDGGMENFIFTSNESTCKITGVKNNQVAEIVVPDYVTDIENGIFDECSNLKNITIGNGITSIDISLFNGCTNLESITIGETNTVYASQDGILYNKEKTEFIYIPRAIKGSVTIPNSIMYIGLGTFEGCKNLESLTLPFVGDSIKTASDNNQYPFGYIFGESKFDGASAVRQKYYKNRTSSPIYTTYYIPDSLKNVTITGGEILYGAFENCTNLTSVTIGNGVTSIGEYAFYDCTAEIKWGDNPSIKEIGKYAFESYKGRNITIPDSITTIGDAFSYCTNLTSITIPDSVISIGEDAFNHCTSLESIMVDENNTAFSSQNGILYNKNKTTLIRVPESKSQVIIPDSVISIGKYAFLGCANLTSITIPNGVTSIGSYAFSGCDNLTSIEIPDSVISIGKYAFSGCTNLTSITIGNGVTSIDSCAFNHCISLESITVDESNTAYSSQEGILYNINKTTLIRVSATKSEVAIPNGVTSIGDGAFSGCKNLKKVTIPNGVTSIGKYAFSGCDNLTSIEIPDSVTSIGYGAFYDCEGLESVTIGSSVTSIDMYAFVNCTSLERVIFDIPNGWYVTRDSSETSGKDIPGEDLQDPATAAGYLENTYYYYHWKRKTA